MSLAADQARGPEGESPSARRLFRAEVWLDRRDALAWEVLPRAMTRREYWAYIAILVLAGMALGVAGEHLPAWVQALPELVTLLAVVAVAHLLWMVLATLARHGRARRRIPERLFTIVEDWGDHLYLRLGPDEEVMVPEAIRQVVTTSSHVFIEDADCLAILPRRAFADATGMADFAARWDRLSAAAAD